MNECKPLVRCQARARVRGHLGMAEAKNILRQVKKEEAAKG